jgi:peptidoglycan/xylan/chitin deacetylase (PgdA/CDA1 family)
MKRNLVFLLFLPLLFSCGKKPVETPETVVERIYDFDAHGAVVRINSHEPVIYLIFTSDQSFEGASHVLEVLDRHGIKGSFFPCGRSLRMEEFRPIYEEIIARGHFIGAHSDMHVLYAPWNDRNHSLLTRDSLIVDLHQNMLEIEKYGVDISKVRYYNPPYQWYNAEQVAWIAEYGQMVLNFTPGVRTSADYTTPEMPNYRSSQELIDLLFAFEAEHEKGLNGAIILIHPGTSEARTDKLYLRLDEIIERLKELGYSFDRL